MLDNNLRTATQFRHLLSLLVCFGLADAHAAGLDAPHDGGNAIGCTSCHQMTSTYPKLLPPLDHTSQNLDDTLANNVCWSCHNDVDAPYRATHSSLQADNGYGNWTVECWICHNEHRQEQNIYNGSTYGQYIRRSINLANISGLGKTGSKSVVFKGQIGANSFADGDTTYNGICEVCHTQTQNPDTLIPRYQNTGNADKGHYEAKQCTLCHDHGGGFNADCVSCHDFPPGALVSAPAPTGSGTAGAHLLHANTKGYNCDTCHLDSYGKAASHNNTRISMGFALFNGQYQGGGYNGQTTANYEPLSTTPATTVVNTGAKTCSNIFCHGRRPDGTLWGGGSNTTPVWDGSVACGDCHGAAAATPPPGGSHSQHTRAYASFGGGYQYPCAFCHKDPAADGSLHGNNRSEVLFSADPMTAGGSYNGNADMLGSYGTCTTVYCHSTVQSSPPGAPPQYRTTPVWGSSLNACDNCHYYSDSTPQLATGSHAPHFSSYDNQQCYTCHNYTATDDACFACHDETFGNPKYSHANHTIDVKFLPLLGGSYSGSGNPGDAYGSCSNVYCHGNYSGSGLSASPTWGNAASGACGTCHGASNNAPPGIENPVNWKDGHVLHAYNGEDWSYQTWPRSYACSLCHSGIVGGTGPASYTITDANKHVSKTVDWKFNTADSRVSASSSYSIASGTQEPTDGTTPRAYGTCGNVYCHSNVQPPDGIGPPSVFDTPQWNGSVAACTGCHAVGYHSAYIESGSHAEHVQGYYYAQGSTASPRNCTVCHKWNPAASRTSCGQQCHDGDEKTYHVNGQVDVLFDSFAGTGAVYNGTPAPGDGFASCSNTYCHSNGTSVATSTISANTTANWGAGSLACTACHGYSPAYANGSPKANSHQVAAHAAAACNFCHNTTTNDGLTIASKVTHVNKIYDVNAGGGSSFTYTYAPTGGTCTGVSCHTGGVTRVWGSQ